MSIGVDGVSFVSVHPGPGWALVTGSEGPRQSVVYTVPERRKNDGMNFCCC